MTIGAFAAGELSVDQVAPIVARAPGWADAEACSVAKSATVTQLRSVVSRCPFEPQAPDGERAPVREPHVGLTLLEDGTWRLSGVLDADQGRVIDKALAEAKDALFSQVDGPASKLDALMLVCRRSLDAIDSVSRRERYRIHVHVDSTTGATTD